MIKSTSPGINPISIPTVDVGTFIPLVGAKFFSCPYSFLYYIMLIIERFLNQDNESSDVNERNEDRMMVNNNTNSQNSDQSDDSKEVSNSSVYNYDFDSNLMIWHCSCTEMSQTTEFNISIYHDPRNSKLFIKFYRLSGSGNIFLSVVNKFCQYDSVSCHLKKICPRALTESCITDNSCKSNNRLSSTKSFNNVNNSNNILNCATNFISPRDYLKSCDSLIRWTDSDVIEALQAISSSLPMLWISLWEYEDCSSEARRFSISQKNPIPIQSMREKLVTLYEVSSSLFITIIYSSALSDHRHCVPSPWNPSVSSIPLPEDIVTTRRITILYRSLHQYWEAPSITSSSIVMVKTLRRAHGSWRKKWNTFCLQTF